MRLNKISLKNNKKLKNIFINVSDDYKFNKMKYKKIIFSCLGLYTGALTYETNRYMNWFKEENKFKKIEINKLFKYPIWIMLTSVFKKRTIETLKDYGYVTCYDQSTRLYLKRYLSDDNKNSNLLFDISCDVILPEFIKLLPNENLTVKDFEIVCHEWSTHWIANYFENNKEHLDKIIDVYGIKDLLKIHYWRYILEPYLIENNEMIKYIIIENIELYGFTKALQMKIKYEAYENYREKYFSNKYYLIDPVKQLDKYFESLKEN